jgi:signal transduction histidine kinase
VGALVLGHVQSVEIGAETAKWMEVLANYVGELTERKRGEDDLRRSREQLRQLSAHLQAAIEEERKRISREMHDELGQQLSLLQLECGVIEDHLRSDQGDLRAKTQSMTNLIDSLIGSVQRISADLRPSLLDNLGIGAAVEWFAKQFEKRVGIECQITVDPPDVKLDQDRSTALFRIFQEALTNVVRHARATTIGVHLIRRERGIVLKVRDNGIGISPGRLADANSLGIMGMRERVHPWGGGVEITGEAGKGTDVTVTIPLEA